MKVGIANDHRGVELKNKIIKYTHDNGIECVDFGTNFKESSDYVDYAIKLCKAINNKEIDLGILICGTGIGMSIAANKVKGIRCARVLNEKEALLAKEHNMANVIALKEDEENYERIIYTFLNTNFSSDERHIRRVEKINKIEGGNYE